MEKTVDHPPLPSGFEGLVALVKALRGENGCPWDREQTPEQIKTYMLEEAYEVLEALESGDPGDLCGELGDLLFHIVFLARIFEESGDFTMADVVEAITRKMVRRHPHVFGNAKVSGTQEVRRRWQEIKMAEACDQDRPPSFPLDSVPKQLPALMRAYRIMERAAKLGIEQPEEDRFFETMDADVGELKAVLKERNSQEYEEKLGKLLFTVVRMARSVRTNPESALTRVIQRYLDRLKPVQASVNKPDQ